jgi:hypothetical protein
MLGWRGVPARIGTARAGDGPIAASSAEEPPVAGGSRLGPSSDWRQHVETSKQAEAKRTTYCLRKLVNNSRETKHIKAWSDGWLAKLRDDQRRSGADLALIEADRDTIDGTAGNEGVKVVCGLRTTPLLQAVVATAKPHAHSVHLQRVAVNHAGLSDKIVGQRHARQNG